MTVARFTGDVRIAGSLQVDGTLPTYPRASLQVDTAQVYALDFTAARVHDAPQTVLSGTAAADDLAIAGVTFATNAMYLTTGDVKALGTTTRRARMQFALPIEYIAGQALTLRLSAGMATTIAGTSATVDAEVCVANRSGAVGTDIVTTAAQSCNSLTFADKDFVLTPTGLTAGDVLDVRLTLVVIDAATGTVVEARIAAAELLLPVQG